MSYKIIKGAAMPPPGGGWRNKYPFPEMQVGDAFDLPIDMRTKAASATGSYSKHHPEYKFSIRKIDENTIRCWRVA